MSAPATASILIVNYNYGRFVADAIDSALAQTWSDVQVVVVDDGSTDESPLMMQTYGDAIQTIYKENGGQASGINIGFPFLTGEVVIFLDSDDVLEPEAIEKTIGAFADPEVVKVHWPFRIIDGAGIPTGRIMFEHLPEGNLRNRALRLGPASHTTTSHSGNIWRKTFLDQVMPVPEDGFRNVVDSYLFTFSPFFGSFRAMDEPLTRYRIHGPSIVSTLTAASRRNHWEYRADLLHEWLVAQGESVSIERWRRNNSFYKRLDGIVRGQQHIRNHVPRDAPIMLIAGPLYDRGDIHPRRPVYRPAKDLRALDLTEADFRAFLTDFEETGIEYIVVQGPSTWKNTNLETLVTLLRNEHTILHEEAYVVIAKFCAISPARTLDR